MVRAHGSLVLFDIRPAIVYSIYYVTAFKRVEVDPE